MRGKAGNGDSFGLWRALSCRSNFGFDATDSEEPLLSPRTYNENSAFGKMNPATMSMIGYGKEKLDAERVS